MSRPLGSGLAVSKSISEFASSIGSDFRYPTAFIPVVSCLTEATGLSCRYSAKLARSTGAAGAAPVLSLLERPLRAHRERIELRAGIAEIGRADLLGDVAVQIVEHESHVAIDVPVQRQRVDVLPSAGDAVGDAELAVEIHSAVAAGDLPGAPAAAIERERMVRNDATVGAAAGKGLAGFAGQHVTRLS